MTNLDAQLPVEPATVIAGKYRIDRVLGVGGMGVVAEAWHLDFEEKVAIKFLLRSLIDNEEAVGRFEREARVLYKIKSEHVCRVIDVGLLEQGVPFMVMEFLDGYDLATRLERREPLPFERAIEYGLQACQALANAHVRGIVHRDLKPENIFIAKETSGAMVLKLLDFGLSKEHDNKRGDRKRQLTGDAQVMGTPHYMSPEQWMASTSVSAASDQWALGAIIFEMLTGEPPFDGPQLANICSAIMNAPTPSVNQVRPDIPPGLDAVLRKALEKHPHNRYDNVGAFAVALAAFAPPGVASTAERALKMLQDTKHGDVTDEETSGAWRALRSARDPSDMAATIKKPPQIEFTPKRSAADAQASAGRPASARGRAVTSTSWHARRLQPRGSRVAVALAATTLLLIAVVAIFRLARAPDPTEDVPVSRADESAGELPGARPVTTTEAAARDMAGAVDVDGARNLDAAIAPNASGAASATPAPDAANREGAGVVNTAKAAALPKPEPWRSKARPGATPRAGGPQPKDRSKPPPKTDIFGDR